MLYSLLRPLPFSLDADTVPTVTAEARIEAANFRGALGIEIGKESVPHSERARNR